MQGRAGERRLGAIAEAYGTKAVDSQRRADIVRAALLSEPLPSEDH